MDKLWFDSWESITRTLITSVAAYVSLVILLRISGKRTLSKMNAFDFIVTIAIGSTLATVLLNKNVALADGVLAMFLLIFLQYIISALAVRSNTVNSMIKGTPALLVYNGEMLEAMMRKERITKDEIWAILREKGVARMEDVKAVVLETDGSLTLLQKGAGDDTDVLTNVRTPQDRRVG